MEMVVLFYNKTYIHTWLMWLHITYDAPSFVTGTDVDWDDKMQDDFANAMTDYDQIFKQSPEGPKKPRIKSIETYSNQNWKQPEVKAQETSPQTSNHKNEHHTLRDMTNVQPDSGSSLDNDESILKTISSVSRCIPHRPWEKKSEMTRNNFLNWCRACFLNNQLLYITDGKMSQYFRHLLRPSPQYPLCKIQTLQPRWSRAIPSQLLSMTS